MRTAATTDLLDANSPLQLPCATSTPLLRWIFLTRFSVFEEGLARVINGLDADIAQRVGTVIPPVCQSARERCMHTGVFRATALYVRGSLTAVDPTNAPRSFGPGVLGSATNPPTHLAKSDSVSRKKCSIFTIDKRPRSAKKFHRAQDLSAPLHAQRDALRLRERRSSPRGHAALDGRIASRCAPTSRDARVRVLAG